MLQSAEKIGMTIAHHSRFDPREHTGGVETFARNLEMLFDKVIYTTPSSQTMDEVITKKIPIICDNQGVLDWPEGHPVIGFQHGVADEKRRYTKARSDRKLAKLQAKAARRDNTIWVACAEWISRSFEELHGNGASRVVYHPIDTQTFDAELRNDRANVILHDGRTQAKGKHLYEYLARKLPRWRFEPLNCRPNQVANRMREARAFMHLSKYEGNSIVCNEAMAMNLPCMFTKVGLMRDEKEFDVRVIDPTVAFNHPEELVTEVTSFLESLEQKTFHPRDWTLANATADHAIDGWKQVLSNFESMSGWSLDYRN